MPSMAMSVGALIVTGATTDGLKSSEFILIKRKFQSKKCCAQMKEHEKCKQTSHHRSQCAKWFSRYSISKSGFWARWTLPFCMFSASFSDAVLQDNKKLNCNVSEAFRLICLKLCRLSELSKEFSLDFKFRYYGNTNQNY